MKRKIIITVCFGVIFLLSLLWYSSDIYEDYNLPYGLKAHMCEGYDINLGFNGSNGAKMKMCIGNLAYIN